MFLESQIKKITKCQYQFNYCRNISRKQLISLLVRLFNHLYYFPLVPEDEEDMVRQCFLSKISSFFIKGTSQTRISFNSFSTNVPLLYPLKTSENLRFFDVFRWYRSGTLVENGFSISENLSIFREIASKFSVFYLRFRWIFVFDICQLVFLYAFANI